MTTLVTGATGFIGSAIVRALVERGEHVRVLCRRNSNRINLEGLSLEFAEGDICDRESVQKAMKGCRWVYHTAGLYAMWAKERKSFYMTNLEGTANVLDAARSEKVEKVVYTSTIGAVGGTLDPKTPCTEETSFNLWETKEDYILSKYLAEREALKYTTFGVPVTIVNPAGPIGEGDFKPTPTGAILLMFLQKRFPICPYIRGGSSFLDVRDVAKAHLLAMEKGKVGERYILSGYNMTFGDIMQKFGEVTGIHYPIVKIPDPVALIGASIMEFISNRITQKPPMLTVNNVQSSRYYLYYDNTKAKTELGWQVNALEPAIERAAKWFKDHRYA